MMEKNRTGISKIELACQNGAPLPAYMQKEQKQALQNLMTAGAFRPAGDDNGPYELSLSIEEGRLLVRMRNAEAQDLNMLVLSLRPYRRLVQDYFLMMESYEEARRHATREKLEAIDMGRRGIHNEGADMLISRLEDKIKMDHETARRLFTLICSLHNTHSHLHGTGTE